MVMKKASVCGQDDHTGSVMQDPRKKAGKTPPPKRTGEGVRAGLRGQYHFRKASDCAAAPPQWPAPSPAGVTSMPSGPAASFSLSSARTAGSTMFMAKIWSSVLME